jgi:hypothetical protein
MTPLWIEQPMAWISPPAPKTQNALLRRPAHAMAVLIGADTATDAIERPSMDTPVHRDNSPDT